MRDISVGDVHIRKALTSDSLCLSALATQVFLDTYAVDGIRPALAREVVETLSVPAITALLGEQATNVLVAEREGNLVGLAQLSAGASNRCVPFAVAVELKRLYVQEPFTGRGVGTALLAHSETAAAACGAEGVWLTAWSGNGRALGFYTKRGYADLGPTPFTIHGEHHENRLFAKILTQPSSLRNTRSCWTPASP